MMTIFVGRRRSIASAMVALSLFCLIAFGNASAAVSPSGPNKNEPSDLLHAWLSFPDAVKVNWTYAFIASTRTASLEQKRQQTLIDELDRLRYRLANFGYPELVDTVDQWRTRLESIHAFRTPGEWSPAYLLANPNHQPPIADIATIGACDLPSSVGVWSAAGYQAVQWRSGLRLSTLEKQIPALREGSQPEIAVVDPFGNIDHYGVQAWNYANGTVAPGSQVIASLPLKGEAFEWIRDSMADLLAHTPSGVDCRRIRINGDTASDDSGN